MCSNMAVPSLHCKASYLDVHPVHLPSSRRWEADDGTFWEEVFLKFIFVVLHKL